MKNLRVSGDARYSTSPPSDLYSFSAIDHRQHPDMAFSIWGQPLLHLEGEEHDFRNAPARPAMAPRTYTFQPNSVLYHGTIAPPAHSIYAGGVFHISIAIGPGYPNEPPVIAFETPIYHPNVTKEGRTTPIFGRGQWNAVMGLQHIMIQLQRFMDNPNLHAAVRKCRGVVGTSRKNPGAYVEKVTQETLRFATPVPGPSAAGQGAAAVQTGAIQPGAGAGIPAQVQAVHGPAAPHAVGQNAAVPNAVPLTIAAQPLAAPALMMQGAQGGIAVPGGTAPIAAGQYSATPERTCADYSRSASHSNTRSTRWSSKRPRRCSSNSGRSARHRRSKCRRAARCHSASRSAGSDHSRSTGCSSGPGEDD